MIMPALTSWPAKIFTPRRLLCESRPFLEEPSPFLCAIASLASSRVRGSSWSSCLSRPSLPLQRGLERGDRALPLRVGLLVLECRAQLRRVPAGGGLLHLRHCQVGVSLRDPGARLGGRCHRGLRLLPRLGLRRRLGLLAADRLDLDLRERRPEAGVTPVAGALL